MKFDDSKKDYLEAYDTANSGWSMWLPEATSDLEFYANAQWNGEDLKVLKELNRTAVTLNKVKRTVNLISGIEIRDRHILKIGPTGFDDDQSCSQMTELVMNAMTCGDGYDILSDCFKWGALCTGANLIEPYLDREGYIKFARRAHNSFLLDPAFTKKDLSDCRYILGGQYLSDGLILEFIPELTKKSLEEIPKGSSLRWNYLSRNHKRKLRMVEEFWRRDSKTIPMIIDRMTGKQHEFDDFATKLGGDKKYANYVVGNDISANGSPRWSKFNATKRMVTLTVFVDGEPVAEQENPSQIDDFNQTLVSGDFIPELERDDLKLQGIVRTLRDIQNVKNKRISQMIDIVEAQLTVWRKAKAGSLVDDRDAYGSGQGNVVWMKEESDMNDFQQLPGVGIPAGVFGLFETLEKEEIQIAGLNESIFGTEQSEVSGVLEKQRTGAALTGQQGLFQSFRGSKRELGRKLVKIIQKNYSDQKIQRITNKPPAQDLRVPDFTKYDCVPTEGLLTDSQRQLYYLELRGLKREDPSIPIPWSEILAAAPMQNKDRLLESIKKQEQQEQQQQEQEQKEKQQLERLREAKIQADLGRGVERQTQAVENRTTAQLNRAKLMTEIQDLQNRGQLEQVDRLLERMRLEIEMEKAMTERMKANSTGDK